MDQSYSLTIACYFNALIQQLFQIDNFVQIILGFCAPYNIDKAVEELGLKDSVIAQRKKVERLGNIRKI